MYRSAHALLQHYVQASTKLSHASLRSHNVKLYRPPLEITVVMATRDTEIADLHFYQ
jgi:hypothetical protein